MNLTEYRAKRDVIDQMVNRFKFIVPGCAQCKHFDFGKCAQNGNEPILSLIHISEPTRPY